MNTKTALAVGSGVTAFFAGVTYLVGQALHREEERGDRTAFEWMERYDRSEQRLSDMVEYFNTTLIPALERSTTATTSAISVLLSTQEQKKLDDALAYKLPNGEEFSMDDMVAAISEIADSHIKLHRRIKALEAADLDSVELHVSATPPDNPSAFDQLWMDTSIANNAVLKYWDGNEYVRMDGGGEIPDGMILPRHLSSTFMQDGKFLMNYLPALALTNVSVVENVGWMWALTGVDEGDVVVVRFNDEGVRQSFIYDGSAWEPLSSPADVTEAELAAAVMAGLTVVMNRIDGLEAAYKDHYHAELRETINELIDARLASKENPES